MPIKLFFGDNNRNIAQYIKNINSCFLPQKEFIYILRREELRSIRYDLSLSLIFVDIAGLLSLLIEEDIELNNHSIKTLSLLFKNSTREVDIKGWFQEGKIAILAPNTNEFGARAIVKNLVNRLLKHSSLNGRLTESDFMQFVCLSSLNDIGCFLEKMDKDYKEKPGASINRSTYHVELPSSFGRVLCSSKWSRTGDVATTEWVFSTDIFRQKALGKLKRKVKRFIDIVGSLTFILLSAPLMVVIAAMIKLTSPGPILFWQKRLGYLGKPFVFLKFRTMKEDSDSSLHKEYVTKLIRGENDNIKHGTAEQPLYKITDDPRVTKVGNFLRKTSLDELPQFFNVLKGDMSLVGPRPPIPYETDQYKPWHFRRIFEVKPGITGLWQVSGRSSTTFDEMVRLDISYARSWSLWLDFKILLKTIWVVFSTKGAS